MLCFDILFAILSILLRTILAAVPPLMDIDWKRCQIDTGPLVVVAKKGLVVALGTHLASGYSPFHWISPYPLVQDTGQSVLLLQYSFNPCVSLLRLSSQNNTDWVINRHFLTLWKAEVQNQGAGRVRVWWEPSLWVEDDCFLTASSHGLPSVHAHRKENELSGSLPLRTPIILDQGPTPLTSFNLNCFLIDPSPNTATLVVRASTYGFGGGGQKTFGH